MRKLLKKIIRVLTLGITKNSIGLDAYQEIVDIAMELQKDVYYGTHFMKFTVPNRLSNYRAETFSSKEPDTLDYIDAIPMGETLWDIGANVGLYSVYAAKSRNCKVFAFEPSVFNLELLARNIFINDLQLKITIIPIALSDKLGSNVFKMSSTTWGGALSTFGEDFDQNGNKLLDVFEYSTLGMTMEQAVSLLNVQIPQHIKMDVDGIEHFILKGGQSILKNVKSILIEINDSFTEQAHETEMHLKNAGLTLFKKCNLGSSNQFNQWWIRK